MRHIPEQRTLMGMSDETKTGGEKGDTKGKTEEAKVDPPIKAGDRVAVAVVIGGPLVKRLEGKVTKVTKGPAGEAPRLTVEIVTASDAIQTFEDLREAPPEGATVDNMASLPCYLRLPPPK